MKPVDAECRSPQWMMKWPCSNQMIYNIYIFANKIEHTKKIQEDWSFASNEWWYSMTNSSAMRYLTSREPSRL